MMAIQRPWNAVTRADILEVVLEGRLGELPANVSENDARIIAQNEVMALRRELTSEAESHERTHRIGLELQNEVERLRTELAKPRCPVATGTCAGCPHAKREVNNVKP